MHGPFISTSYNQQDADDDDGEDDEDFGRHTSLCLPFALFRFSVNEIKTQFSVYIINVIKRNIITTEGYTGGDRDFEGDCEGKI